MAIYFNEGEVSTLEIYNLFPGSWASNCYLLVSEDEGGDKHAAVVDPSTSAKRILDECERLGARLEYIILTHGHFDHITSLDALREMAGVPAYIHMDDAEMLPDGEKNAYTFFFGEDKTYRPAEKTLQDGDILTLGCDSLEIIGTPGHSKGSICILNRQDKTLITGDTLFAEGYGRYDLHGGNPKTLAKTLSSMRTLDRNLTIYPGHGDSEKLGRALDNLYFI